MLPYWIVFGTFAAAALSRVRLDRSLWWTIGLLLIFFVGLRYRVGGDWGSYRNQVWRSLDLSLVEVLEGRDPGYQLLNWIAAQSGADVWLVNLLCAALFVSGLLRFVQRMPDPLLALTAATPYLIFIVAMGYSRQAAAIGALFYAIIFFEQRRLFLFAAACVAAASFHQTAVMFVGIAVLASIRRGIFSAVALGIVAFGMYQLFLAERTDRLIYGYIESSYAHASRGGFIRVLMTALAGATFILIARRMRLPPHVKAFWFWISVTSLAFLALMSTSPTAVDRMGLYLLPLQVFVVGHLSAAFRGGEMQLGRPLVVGFYLSALFVWMLFADNRNYWIPYQNWLLPFEVSQEDGYPHYP